MPAKELAGGVLILVGGILMLTPGFVLDIFGALCILPFTRPIGRRALSRVISRKLVGVGIPGASYPGAAGCTAWGSAQDPGPGPDVVRGDVVE